MEKEMENEMETGIIYNPKPYALKRVGGWVGDGFSSTEAERPRSRRLGKEVKKTWKVPYKLGSRVQGVVLL